MDADESARALIGTTVADKYRVLDVLGAGGMGTVYLAEHVFTKRRVALKRMHPDLGRSKQAAERFIRESQAPSTIGHPGIVQVLDGGSQPDGSLYIVHELLEGVALSEAIARNTLTASAVVQLGVELLQALAAAHDKGIIHRDIKPDNVFIAHDGSGSVSIKLLDFGIAALRDAGEAEKLTRPGSVLGTAQYMSPEQAMAEPADERSDLWSVGALLYHALSGRLPYPGDSYRAVIYALASKQHIPLALHRPDLPQALVDVVERALRKPAAERFASAAQMGAALAAVRFDVVATATTSLATGEALGQSAPRARRSSPLATLAMLAGCLLVGSFVWLSLSVRVPLSAAEGALDALPVPTRPRTLPSSNADAAAQVGATAPQLPGHGLPLSALAPVLSARQPELERCLQESAVSQLLAGAERVTTYRLDVSLSVEATGHVETVELSGPLPAELSRCLRAVLLSATFPAAAQPTLFRYPLVLAPTVVGQ